MAPIIQSNEHGVERKGGCDKCCRLDQVRAAAYLIVYQLTRLSLPRSVATTCPVPLVKCQNEGNVHWKGFPMNHSRRKMYRQLVEGSVVW